MSHEELVGKTWAKQLENFLSSSTFKNIGKELMRLEKSGEKVIPDFNKIFSNFKNCPYDDSIVVWLMKLPPRSEESKKMVELINDTLSKYSGEKGIWKSKSTLLLPINPTTTEKGDDHSLLWEEFTKAVMTSLQKKAGILYLLIGKEAKPYAELINPVCNDMYFIEHPMNAIIKNRPWKHGDVFIQIDRVSDMIHNKKIFSK